MLTEPEQPKQRSLVKSILKQIALAVGVGAVILTIYLMIVNEDKADKWEGKYAYIGRTGEYVGVIKGKGRSTKSGSQVFYIKQPTGELIELSATYVEVRDKPPKLDD